MPGSKPGPARRVFGALVAWIAIAILVGLTVGLIEFTVWMAHGTGH